MAQKLQYPFKNGKEKEMLMGPTSTRLTVCVVIELNLEKKGNWDGKIYQQANISLTNQGMIEPD